MFYKDKTFYEYLKTLNYIEGSLYDGKVRYDSLESIIENAYITGYEECKSNNKREIQLAVLYTLLTVLCIVLLIFCVVILIKM